MALNDPAEKLYRGITSHNWVESEKRVSSSAFKDSNGVSVDRQQDRTDTECVQFIIASRPQITFIAVASLIKENVDNVNAIIVEKPSIENDVVINPFHCEIHSSETKVKLTGSQANKLAEVATENIEYLADY